MAGQARTRIALPGGEAEPMEITYEVYVQKDGRWTLEARYNSSQKDEAIGEAKQLQNMPQLAAVKVVRETYDGNNNRIREKTVYTTEGSVEKSRSFDPSAAGGGDGGGGGSPEPVVYDIPGYDFGGVTNPPDTAPSIVPQVKIPGRGAAVAATGRGLRSGEAIVLYKLLVVAVVSFGFASLVTFIYSSYVG